MNTKTKHWASITAGILSLAGYASAANLGSEKYTYDASGNIIEKSIDGKVTKMSYDGSNRVTAKQSNGQSMETISYDGAGRPVSFKNEEILSLRSVRYGYDDKVIEARGSVAESEFYYNAEGVLVGNRTAGVASTYAWDGNVLAAENSEAFVNEAHISGGVPVISSGTDVMVSDYLGNTLISGEKEFDGTAFGEGLEAARFTGKPFVKDLGAFFFNCRLYSPQITRWTTMDPSGFPDGLNSFSYVTGDPISKIDALGLSAWVVYQNPASPPPRISAPPQPASNTFIFSTTTNGTKHAHSHWNASGSPRVGAKDEHIQGSITVDGDTMPYDVTPPATYAAMVEGVTSGGNIYLLAQDWEHGDNNTVVKDGSETSTWNSNYASGIFHGLRYSREN